MSDTWSWADDIRWAVEAETAVGFVDDEPDELMRARKRILRMGYGVNLATVVASEVLTFEDLLAHWSTFLTSVDPDGLLMHPWSPPDHRHACAILEVRHEFCGVRWSRTPRPATGLCASERRSVSDRLRSPGTTGWIPTAATARNPR